jgi:hypothetical protein
MNLLEKNKSIIEQFIESNYKHTIHINTEIDLSLPDLPVEKKENKQKTIENISKTDPMVNKLISELGLELT